MAAWAVPLLLLQLLSLFFVFLCLPVVTAAAGAGGCFSRMFAFGDSLTDTGNYVYITCSLNDTKNRVHRLPYGETYFHRPAGRFSDGRLIVDFFAEAFGLPMLLPSQAGKRAGYFRSGANFAVGGATALNKPAAALVAGNERLHNCLGTQIRWIKDLLPLLCRSSSECKEMMETSLFLVGEIGGNDYNGPFLGPGASSDELLGLVHSVVNAISSAITELIGIGGKMFVVPGNLPIGCAPVYLIKYASENKDDYDQQTGCLRWLNDFSEYHNRALETELVRLRTLHPHTIITYADYFESAMDMYRNPTHFGFAKSLTACCGSGESYGSNSTAARCGEKGSQVCEDPSSYVSWDGTHWTESAYKVISHGVLHGPHARPPVAASCPTLQLHNKEKEQEEEEEEEQVPFLFTTQVD